MKIIDERETQKKKRGTEAIVKRWEINGFAEHLN